MEETLGKRIVLHRKKLGLTQDQLAEKLGVTAQAVSKWENDQSCPDINMLPKLAELFGTSTDALLGCDTVYEGEVVDGKQKPPQDKQKSNGSWEFHWDAGRKSALSFAFFVLLVGGLLLAARILEWDVGFWSITWPSALLVFGFAALLHHPCFTNLVCTLLGAYFLADKLHILPISLDKGLIFPALIVIFGLSLLFDALRKPKKGRFHITKNGATLDHKTKKHYTQEGEFFDCSLTFGEISHEVTLPRLSGGKAAVSFGEMTVDLTGCGEIVDGCQIEVGVSFGELHLQVPREYRVMTTGGTTFGEINTHGHPRDEVRGTISLTGGVSFGELDIHYV